VVLIGGSAKWAGKNILKELRYKKKEIKDG